MFSLLVIALIVTVHAGTSDALVFRYRNLQFFEMVPSQHPPGNALVFRYKNMQFFEMTPSQHPPGDALVFRYRNLQFFEMESVGPLTVSITSFTTTDQNGNPKTTFTPGSTVMLKIVITGNGTQNIPNALISTITQDPYLTPIFLSYTYENIQVGTQTTIYLGFQIPYNSILGSYTVKVNIFTRLPSQGGEAVIGGHAQTNFTVS